MSNIKQQLLLSKFISLANHIPKNDNQIAFYSTPDIGDNALAFFKYIYSLGEDYELVWVLNKKNPPALEVLKQEYPDVRGVHLYSSGGFKELIRSKFIITTDVLPITPHSGQRIIQLWHGLPGKKTGYEHPLGIRDLYLYMDRWTTDFVTTSELAIGAFVRQFMINPRKFRLLGQPRNDGMLKNLESSKGLLSNVLGIDVEMYEHLILYAPTYRYTSYMKDFKASVKVVKSLFTREFQEFLKKENALLIIKPHKLVADALISSIDKTENTALLTDTPLQSSLLTINDIMGAFDILITDYSSIFEDYILLDRPIVFYLPDREELERKSGFLLPYDFFAPGDKPETPTHLITSLKSYFEEPFKDGEWRRTIKNLLYEVGDDANSAKRVYKTLIKRETS